MKKLLIIAILFAGCRQSHDGFYVNHTDGQYAITDDTLEVRDSTIISHTGFQKIRNGQTLPKQYKTQQLFELHPIFNGQHLILNNISYEKM